MNWGLLNVRAHACCGDIDLPWHLQELGWAKGSVPLEPREVLG